MRMRSFGSALCIGAVMFATVPAAAQTKRLKLDGEVCTYELRFDPKTVEERRIRDTFELLFNHPGYVFAEAVTGAADVDRLLPGLDAECKRLVERWTGAALLPIPGLDAFHRGVLEEVTDSCRFDRIKLLGYRDPSALRGYERAAACGAFVDALEGKRDLRAAYDALGKEVCRDNADTKACLTRWTKQATSPERMKLELVGFGWGNCANATTLRGTVDREAAREKLSADFLKRYKVKQTCDEP